MQVSLSSFVNVLAGCGKRRRREFAFAPVCLSLRLYLASLKITAEGVQALTPFIDATTDTNGPHLKVPRRQVRLQEMLSGRSDQVRPRIARFFIEGDKSRGVRVEGKIRLRRNGNGRAAEQTDKLLRSTRVFQSDCKRCAGSGGVRDFKLNYVISWARELHQNLTGDSSSHKPHRRIRGG